MLQNIISLEEFTEELKLNEKFKFFDMLKNKKVFKALKNFFINIKQEGTETKEAAKLIKKYVSNGKISKEEGLIVKTQFYDILKGLGIGIPFMLIPGASLLIPFMLYISRKMNIELLPSSFQKKENIIIDNIDSKDIQKITNVIEGDSEQNKIIDKIIHYNASIDDFKNYWKSKLKKS